MKCIVCGGIVDLNRVVELPPPPCAPWGSSTGDANPCLQCGRLYRADEDHEPVNDRSGKFMAFYDFTTRQVYDKPVN